MKKFFLLLLAIFMISAISAPRLLACGGSVVVRHRIIYEEPQEATTPENLVSTEGKEEAKAAATAADQKKAAKTVESAKGATAKDAEESDATQKKTPAKDSLKPTDGPAL